MDELIAKAKAGDLSARAELLAQVRSRLRQWAEHALNARFNSRLDASDLTQLTLLDVHQKIDQFVGNTAGELDAWLRTALRRNIIDSVRDATAQKRSVGREQSLAADPLEQRPALVDNLIGDASTPSVRAMRKEESDRLQLALEKLSPDHQKVIRLVHLQGCSLAIASTQLDREVGATAKLLQRAMASLRKLLENTE